MRDAHTWCPCNGVLACATCHAKMHARPEWARSVGLHVSSFVAEPGDVPVSLVVGTVRLDCIGGVTFL